MEPEAPGRFFVCGVYSWQEGSLTLVFASDYNSRSCGCFFRRVCKATKRDAGGLSRAA